MFDDDIYYIAGEALEMSRTPITCIVAVRDAKACALFIEVGFGLDGVLKLLYHADLMTGVWAYDATADGGVENRRMFAKMPKGVPDGLAVDAAGNVLVAAPMSDEVVRFKPDGTIDQRIALPGKLVLSLVFAGADLCDLYVVTGDQKGRTGSIFRARADIPGLAVPKARF